MFCQVAAAFCAAARPGIAKRGHLGFSIFLTHTSKPLYKKSSKLKDRLPTLRRFKSLRVLTIWGDYGNLQLS